MNTGRKIICNLSCADTQYTVDTTKLYTGKETNRKTPGGKRDATRCGAVFHQKGYILGFYWKKRSETAR